MKDFNLDVGCMQINIKWHKNNFKKIIDMFAVEPNVSYAASFLLQLKNKHGSWDKAIKHYHSSDPNKNKPYLETIRFNLLCQNTNAKPIALGGINATNINRLFCTKAYGYAGISGIKKTGL